MNTLAYSGRLSAYDFPNSVAVHHSDGSFFFWEGAFYTREQLYVGPTGGKDFHDFYVVYTEHHGYLVFPVEDVKHITGEFWGLERKPHYERNNET